MSGHSLSLSGDKDDNPRLWVPSDDVKHACPMCPIGSPRPLCACCGGHGTITEKRLHQWNREVMNGMHG